jgi:hypothetical protein
MRVTRKAERLALSFLRRQSRADKPETRTKARGALRRGSIFRRRDDAREGL